MHTNLVNLLAQVPWPLVAGWLLANVIPYLSALGTRAPTWATGFLTLVLSLVDGILSELATNGGYDWRAALGTAFIAWAVAALHHSKILKGTAAEVRLHAVGAR